MATPFGQIPLRTCTEHKGRPLEMYCDNCDTLLCLKCHLSTHKGHDVCELSDLTPKKKQDIQTFIDNTEQNDLVQLQECISSTDILLKDNTSNFEKLSNKIKMQTEKLKNDLDSLTVQTLSLYHKMEEDNNMLIQKYKQDLEMYDKQLRQQIQKCQTALLHGSQIEIYDTGCEINSQIRLPIKPVLHTASFIPNQNPQHNLELAFGEITKSDQGQASTDQGGSVRTSDGQKPSSTLQQSETKGKKAVTKLLLQTEVLEEWWSPVVIKSMCPTTDGQVWTSNDSRTLTLLDRKGKVQQQVKHSTNINSISMAPTTLTLWVSDDKNNILELVSGQMTHRFTTNETSWCICVTASNHVIVGMTNSLSKFTTQGQMVLTASATRTGKSLVRSPRSISECPVTHNVAVVDRNYKDFGGGGGIPRVIVIDTDFRELLVYRGDIFCPYTQTPHKEVERFDPLYVVYDSVGNIVIGDNTNNRVLLISRGGEFLRVIHTDTGWTWGVGVDREDVLWAVFKRDVKLLQYSSM